MKNCFMGALILCSILILGASHTSPAGQPKTKPKDLTNAERELLDLETKGFEAIVKNDANQIARGMADDWCIIHTNGSIMSRAQFLGLVKSGAVTHSLMNGKDWRIKIYGNTAVVTYEARSEGKYKGRAFSTHERATSVYARIDGRLLCVLTQLTSFKKK